MFVNAIWCIGVRDTTYACVSETVLSHLYANSFVVLPPPLPSSIIISTMRVYTHFSHHVSLDFDTFAS